MMVKRVAVTLNITRTTQFNMQRSAHKKMDVAQREWNKSDIGRCALLSLWIVLNEATVYRRGPSISILRTHGLMVTEWN